MICAPNLRNSISRSLKINLCIGARFSKIVLRLLSVEIEAPHANWFRGKSVALWGCGAIGAQIAEGVVRAGASRLIIYDKARIKPGVLIRQPYE